MGGWRESRRGWREGGGGSVGGRAGVGGGERAGVGGLIPCTCTNSQQHLQVYTCLQVCTHHHMHTLYMHQASPSISATTQCTQLCIWFVVTCCC